MTQENPPENASRARKYLWLIVAAATVAIAASVYVTRESAKHAADLRPDGKVAFGRFGFAAGTPGGGWIVRINPNDPVGPGEPSVLLVNQERNMLLSIGIFLDPEAEYAMNDARTKAAAAGIETTDIAVSGDRRGFAASATIEGTPMKYQLIVTPFKGRSGKSVVMFMAGPLDKEQELIQVADAVLNSIEPL
jgi:hypothetical protein